MIDYMIIRGPIGAGKTSVAERLSNVIAADHHTFFVEFDLFRRKLGIGDPIYKNRNRGTVLLAKRMNELMEDGFLPVVEGVFYESNISYLINNVRGSGFLLKLMAPLDVCIERDKERIYSRGIERVVPVWNILQDPMVGELVIDTNDRAIDEVVADIYAHFRSQVSS